MRASISGEIPPSGEPAGVWAYAMPPRQRAAKAAVMIILFIYDLYLYNLPPQRAQSTNIEKTALISVK
jgi:hypothetical protein